MEIIFDGQHSDAQASEYLVNVIQLLKERYHIHQFREIHLSITLVDESGQDVELVDSQTNQPYRMLEVYQNQDAVVVSHRIRNHMRCVTHGIKSAALKLVVDNTLKNK